MPLINIAVAAKYSKIQEAKVMRAVKNRWCSTVWNTWLGFLQLKRVLKCPNSHPTVAINLTSISTEIKLDYLGGILLQVALHWYDEPVCYFKMWVIPPEVAAFIPFHISLLSLTKCKRYWLRMCWGQTEVCQWSACLFEFSNNGTVISFAALSGVMLSHFRLAIRLSFNSDSSAVSHFSCDYRVHFSMTHSMTAKYGSNYNAILYMEM